MSRLNRCAIAAAAWILLAIFTGAFATSSRIAMGGASPVLSIAHIAVSAVAFLLAFVLAVWAARSNTGRDLRVTVWLSLAALAVSGVTGTLPPSAAGVAWHAVVSHLAIGLAAAAALLSSPEWSRPAKPVDAAPWNALRPAALAMPPAVLLQIAMGAFYRNQVIGVMPHMLGAMVVALLTLVVAALLLQHFAEQRVLKRTAAILISLVLAQVCLGIGAFMMVLLNAGNGPAFAWLATAHVCVGAMTFAASVVCAVSVRRYLVVGQA